MKVAICVSNIRQNENTMIDRYIITIHCYTYIMIPKNKESRQYQLGLNSPCLVLCTQAFHQFFWFILTVTISILTHERCLVAPQPSLAETLHPFLFKLSSSNTNRLMVSGLLGAWCLQVSFSQERSWRKDTSNKLFFLLLDSQF